MDKRVHCFGHFEVRPVERQLLIDGRPAALGARAFDVLLALIERRDRLVGRNELLDLVWPGIVVEENNLAVQVGILRKLLGTHVIATIPGRGYRFTAPPRDETPTAPAARREPLHEALPALIGRDDELSALGALLHEQRLVSVVGTGGIGKTVLAQHLLARCSAAHAHGAAWVELAALSEPAQVAGAVAAALDLRLGGGDALAGLVAALAPLDLLLALDNCEHLIDEVARIGHALLERAPRVRLLITSQAPLKLAHEHVYRLGALAVPSATETLAPADALGYGAVALFTERARAAGRDFALSAANCADVIDIVRRLDGLPLAIELAAARVPLLGVQHLRESLGERLRVLTAGSRDAPARQRTLRAALEWSHGLLGCDEQAVFRRLAVVAGSASLELVQQIAADERLDAWGVMDALGHLVDRSLVAVSEAEPARLRLLETPRAFALERLAAAGEQDTLRERHARAVAATFERTHDDCYAGGLRIDTMRALLEQDLDNARAAFAWALAHEAATALAMTPALLAALTRTLPAERLAVCDAVEPLLLDDRLPLALRAHAALHGAIAVSNHHHLRGLDWARRALALSREAGEPRRLCQAWAAFGFSCSRDADRLDDALAALQQMRSLFDPAWPPQLAHRIVGSEGTILSSLGRHGESAAALRRADRLQQLAGLPEPSALNNLVFAELQAERFDDAARDGRALMARLQGSRNGTSLDLARLNFTAALLGHGEIDEAEAVARAGWPQAASFLRQPYWAAHLAWLSALQGRSHTAARLLGYADAALAALHDKRNTRDQKSYERVLHIARQALGAAEVERLRAEGTALRDEDIATLAFGADVPKAGEAG